MLKSLRGSRRKDPKASLRETIGEFELPTFPKIINEAIGMISSADADLGAVGELLSRDPGVSMKLLQIVNSASFAPRRPIESAKQAATMLGRNQVESLLISMAVRQSLPTPRTDGFDPASFWLASARRAAAAARLSDLTQPASKSSNFTAALLQDMALPVLAIRQDAYMQGFRGHLHAKSVDEEVAEVGWHHGEVGSWMGEVWDLPTDLVRSIERHHVGLLAPDPDIPVIVSALDPDDDPERVEIFVELVQTTLGVDADTSNDIITTSHLEATEIAAMFDLRSAG